MVSWLVRHWHRRVRAEGCDVSRRGRLGRRNGEPCAASGERSARMERPPDQRPDRSAFDQAWRDNRRYLLDVAYRMLGSISEAEDIVQEAFVRLVRADLDQIQDVRGWLVVVVGRLCLDQLRSARSQRQAYVGPWLPEPLIQPPGAAVDPAERVTL